MLQPYRNNDDPSERFPNPYVHSQPAYEQQTEEQPVSLPPSNRPVEPVPPPEIPENPHSRTYQRPTTALRTGAIIALTILLAAVFGVGLFAGWQFGRSNPEVNGTLQPSTGPVATVPPLTGSNTESVREAVIAKVRPSVVQVNVDTQNGKAIGSGVIIDRRGYIVTNNHVVSGVQQANIALYGGSQSTAQVVGTDATDDLAILKITPPASNIAVATLADSSKLKVGQEVLAIGNPLGITQTVTNGIISALNRNVSEGQNSGATLPNAIQTDAPINPGNSGGALVDMQGNLVGIPTLSAIDPEFNTPANGVGFAIPSNRVHLVAPQIIASGNVTHTGRAALGITVASVDPTLASQNGLSVDHGALIAKVTPDGSAAKAGLQPGDVIVKIDTTDVNDVSSLGDALANKNPGDTVAVHIFRGNQQLTINATLGELQAR